MAGAAINRNKPLCLRDDALVVLKTLRDAGHVAYFAGGCVRDQLLGRPVSDYDVACDAPPQRVRQLFARTQAVGAAFGVILVRHQQSVVEVATFRRDGTYSDGRHPAAVAFTDAAEDARRRDFTINGLFFDPLENRVIDYVGGQADLAAKIVRAIGDADQRFAEDHLRLLRAVRFAARLDFAIEALTAAAIRRHAGQLPRISPERIAEELRNMLGGPTRRGAWKLLGQLELLPILFRYASVPPIPADLRTASMTPLVCLLEDEAAGLGLILAAAAVDLLQAAGVGPDSLGAQLDKAHRGQWRRMARQSFRLSNDEADELDQCLEGLAMLIDSTPATLAQLKRFLAWTYAESAMRLVAAVRQWGWHATQIDQTLEQLRRLRQTDFAPPPLLSGDDLVAAGFAPGPAFKKILAEIYDRQLEGRINTPEQAFAEAQCLLGRVKQSG